MAAWAKIQGADMDDVTDLIAKLHDPDSNVRRNAAVALGKSGSPAVSALIDALQDTDGDVRWMAVTALGKILDADAIPALSIALKDFDPGVRRAAAKSLGRIHVPQAVPALIDALQDRDVCVAATVALGELQDPSAIPALIAVFQNAGWAGEPESALPVNVGTTVLTSVTESQVVSNIRAAALRALAKFKDPRVLPILIDALQSEDARMSVHADFALIQRGSKAVPALAEVLRTGNADARQNALELLGRIGDAQAIPALIAVLESEARRSKFFRKAPDDLMLSIAEVLGNIAVADPAPWLRAALPVLDRLRKRDPIFQEVFEEIAAATEGMKDLPLPTTGPPLDSRNLPRPAIAPDLSLDGLPIPASAENEDKGTVIAKRRWFWREKRR